jgi:hypothetical protein
MQFADQIVQDRTVVMTDGIADPVEKIGADAAVLTAECVCGRRFAPVILLEHVARRLLR